MLRVLLIGLLLLVVSIVLGLVAVVLLLKRVVKDVQAGLDDLRRETLPLLDQTRTALAKSSSEERRADALIDAATSLTGTADAATRFAYRMVTNPFVKVIAFFTGTKRAVKTLSNVTAPGGAASKRIETSRTNASKRASRRNAIPVASSKTQDRAE